MPFKSKEELGGKIDPNINTEGRIQKEHKPTAKSIRNKELLMLVRKLKPHVGKSVTRSAEILDKEDATPDAILKASNLILKFYRDVVKDIYDLDCFPEADADPEEVNKSAPLFSLTRVTEDPNKK